MHDPDRVTAGEGARRAFLAAIAQDRYDQATRLVFADWLDERGEDDAAAEQRRWTPRWQQAEDYLLAFARKTGLPLGEVVAAGHKYSRTGKGYGVGMNFEPDNWLFDGDAGDAGEESRLAEFWGHWREYTRSDLEALPTGGPFLCCHFEDGITYDEDGLCSC